MNRDRLDVRQQKSQNVPDDFDADEMREPQPHLTHSQTQQLAGSLDAPFFNQNVAGNQSQINVNSSGEFVAQNRTPGDRYDD